MAKHRKGKQDNPKPDGSIDPSSIPPVQQGDPNNQDPKRRLGNFTGAGEHARQSGLMGKSARGKGKKPNP